MKRKRKFVPIGEAELRAKLDKYIEEDGFGALRDALEKDLKVEFDCENWEDRPGGFGPEPLMGYFRLMNGLTAWGCCAGGDWEYPVYFLIYWDGKKLRAYVPTDGNPYNTDSMQAYGNDEVSDRANYLNRYPDRKAFFPEGELEVVDCLPNFDAAAIERDVLERFEPAEAGVERPPAAPGRPGPTAASLDQILLALRQLSPDEFRASLVRAGIVDESGRLTEPYRRGEPAV